jgi:hypothetical protein
MMVPGGLSTEVGGMVGVVIAALGGPALIKWLVTYFTERRDKLRDTRAAGNREWEAKLKEREDALDERIAEGLKSCEAHCAQLAATVDRLKLAVLLLAPEIARLSPTSPALRQVTELLADVIPVKFDIPADMQAMLDKLD